MGAHLKKYRWALINAAYALACFAGGYGAFKEGEYLYAVAIAFLGGVLSTGVMTDILIVSFDDLRGAYKKKIAAQSQTIAWLRRGEK